MRLEESDREICELRYLLTTRIDDVRLGNGVFDADMRDLVRRLRELEFAAGDERREVGQLIAAALDAVLAHRKERGALPRPALWREPIAATDAGVHST